MGIAKQCIELTLMNIRPVSSAPYSARPCVRELEKSEKEKMLQMNVIEQAQLDWALKLVFALKKEGFPKLWGE